MSANRLKNTKKKFQDIVRKDLTPKNSRPSPKISPVYSSFRGGLTIKPDLIPKTKIIRPATSKNNSDIQQPFFHSNNRQASKTNYSSTKKISKDQNIRKTSNNHTNGIHLNNNNNSNNHNHNSNNSNQYQYQYQPRSKSKSPLKQSQQIIKHQLQIKYPLHISTFRDIKSYNNQRPDLVKILPNISNFQKAKHSVKPNGLIKAYAASTNQGPVRQYNQDRVAIILNIAKPQHCLQWKKAAYFGVFDGHGGVDCADFLRDNLHIYVSKQKSFPDDMQTALINGFQKCQKAFNQHSRIGRLDRSGSCAIVTFFYGNMLYTANVGDSRAIMSSKYGEIISQLSIDHKASCQYQQKRIFDAGGKIYQTRLQHANPNIKIFYQGQQHPYVLGPHRVMPGRLSVTRTFGDIQAKLPQLKGNPKAIIHQPQVRTIKITNQQDFILLASDGIFDKMNNSQIISIIWDTLKRQQGNYKNIHQFCGLAVQNVMKLAFYKKTLDNITVVMIALEGLQRYFSQRQTTTNANTNSYINTSMNMSSNNNTNTNNTNNYMSNNNYNSNNSFNKTINPISDSNTRRQKINSKYQPQFQRKYIGRSTSPTNYGSIKSHSFYRNN